MRRARRCHSHESTKRSELRLVAKDISDVEDRLATRRVFAELGAYAWGGVKMGVRAEVGAAGRDLVESHTCDRGLEALDGVGRGNSDRSHGVGLGLGLDLGVDLDSCRWIRKMLL